MAETKIISEEETRIAAAVKAAQKELDNITAKVKAEGEKLTAIKEDKNTFEKLKRDIEGYKHRYVKFHDLAKLEERVAELEKQFKGGK